jgi:hypothetical protein
MVPNSIQDTKKKFQIVVSYLLGEEQQRAWGMGAQRPVVRVNELENTCVHSAPPRSAAKSPLVINI